MLETISAGLGHLTSAGYWLAIIGGVFVSATVGMIPGVGTPLILSILIPFVLFTIHDPLTGIVLLATIGGTHNTLDSIPAVLLGYPGVSTQVTYLEGHQMARRGQAAFALGAGYAVSALGGIVAGIVLILLIPVVRPFILNFSYSEIAAMGLFGVAMVSVLSTGAMVKGIAAGLIGILLSSVGTHFGTATERFTFGNLGLSEGLPLIAIALGIFAMPEILDMSVMGKSVAAKETAVISHKEVRAGAMEGLRRWRITIRQSLIGVAFGAIPGVGSAVIDWLAYAVGVALAKDKSEFGKGSLDGLIFAEAAQNAKEGGQAIPTLAFGVPGGIAWVFVLYAMLSYGIAPGPQMLGEHADITIMLALSFAIANFLAAAVGFALTGQLAKLTTVPYAAIGAIIIPVSFLSAFESRDGWMGVVVLLLLTPVGLGMKAFKWPRSPLVLGFILGPVIELNLQSALSAYTPLELLKRPLTDILLVMIVVTTWFILRLSRQMKLPSGSPEESRLREAGSFAIGDTERDRHWTWRKMLRGAWRLEHAFALVILAAAAAAAAQSFHYPSQARFLPLVTGGTVCALTLFHLLFQRRVQYGEIMDIGLRSRSEPGVGRRSAILAGFLALLLLLAATVGLKYACIVTAILVPMGLLEGRARWITSLVGGLFLTLLSLGLLDYYMGVYWPEPFLTSWALALLSR
jgi:TctA family transporter